MWGIIVDGENFKNQFRRETAVTVCARWIAQDPDCEYVVGEKWGNDWSVDYEATEEAEERAKDL